MLSKLSVHNYAIIDRLEIAFTDRLNIVTGETGAGKSILVGALGLVLGQRADSSVLRDRDRKAVVEAVFEGEGLYATEPLLKDWDIDGGGELILRREIAANGKSRAFVNDTPVNLSQLSRLSGLLVDLHLQFDTLDLGRSDFQRQVLDALAGNEKLFSEYRSAHAGFTRLKREHAELGERLSAGNRELDYKRFLLEELREADWKEGEMERLEEELRMLSRADGIRSTIERLRFDLSESESPLVQQLKSMANALSTVAEDHPSLPELRDRMQSAHIELQDIVSELDRIHGKLSSDPSRIEELNRRIATGQRLMKKHGVRTSSELVTLAEELELAVGLSEQGGERLEELAREMKAAEEKALALGRRLSEARKGKTGPLTEQVEKGLARVGMPNARFGIELVETGLQEGGLETVVFGFDANRSGRFEPLHKVASGGELSRLMLVVKSLVAGSLSMPTLIFDEIDSGISGEAARQVGILMRELGDRHQVVSITHQPQIAARAHSHFLVYKEDVAGRLQTGVRRLSETERVDAVARMLAGEKPSAVVIENAREMIASA
jgi:DNA repair protein RecN (Recombination protein N)